jgi:hypothetical protein
MVKLRLLSAALLAAAVIAAPATAREHHSRRAVNDANAYVVAPETDYAAPTYAYGYHCVPAPRVGSFAGQPWENSVPCMPPGYASGY